MKKTIKNEAQVFTGLINIESIEGTKQKNGKLSKIFSTFSTKFLDNRFANHEANLKRMAEMFGKKTKKKRITIDDYGHMHAKHAQHEWDNFWDMLGQEAPFETVPEGMRVNYIISTGTKTTLAALQKVGKKKTVMHLAQERKIGSPDKVHYLIVLSPDLGKMSFKHVKAAGLAQVNMQNIKRSSPPKKPVAIQPL